MNTDKIIERILFISREIQRKKRIGVKDQEIIDWLRKEINYYLEDFYPKKEDNLPF